MFKKKSKIIGDPLDRSAAKVAHVLETQLPLGHKINFPVVDGLYTVRNKSREEEEYASPFISEINRVSGFVESTGTTRVDLTGKRKKIVKTLSGSVFHFFADDVCDILYAINLYPDAEVILDMSKVTEHIEHPDWSFIGFFIDALQDQGIPCKLVDISQFDIIYINDFCVAESAFRSSLSGSLIFDFFKKYITNPEEKPYRSVYLSRRKVSNEPRDLATTAAKLSYNSEKRVDDEEYLEQVFRNLGFEVIYPEDFLGFHEQLNFFHSVKTLASLTSSGLTNGLFMQDGGTIIEVSTPLVVISPILLGSVPVWEEKPKNGENYFMAQELHMFYKIISYLKNHTYLSINNPNRNAKEIEQEILNNDKLLRFISNVK